MSATIQKHTEGSVRDPNCPAITDFEAECICPVLAEIVTEQTLESLIAENILAVNAMRETLEHQVTLLGEIKDAIAPMLDKLSASPMFRMMFPGDKE